ncbi:alpha/beta fold hydrolase [Streptomyces albidochromogenes]|uniref:alpha/beta fold hydrolase n=1 Tax=Streptomyces albidochromogenes TaxID=329524 RepID=UPI001FCB2E70|nr:alpha/beta hydrolase [Streptomyces albidochromogenes]
MRSYFLHDGRQMSYLDFGGPGQVLLAAHGHYNEAAAFAAPAAALAPQWRVVALDQRGHGESDRAAGYGREDYVADLAAFHEHLDVGPVPLLGHSLGGVNAYQYAARHPERVTSLIVEDIGAVVDIDTGFTERLPDRAPTREALVAALGPAAPYLECSLRPSDQGWGFSFDQQDTIASQKALSGEHWADWTAVACRTLLIRGEHSDELSHDHAREMIARHIGPAHLIELPAGHVVHHDALALFTTAVRTFLDG